MIICPRATGVTSKLLSEVLFPGCDTSITSSNPSCSLYICGSPFFPVFLRIQWCPFKLIFSFTCLKWINDKTYTWISLWISNHHHGQSQLFAWVQRTENIAITAAATTQVRTLLGMGTSKEGGKSTSRIWQGWGKYVEVKWCYFLKFSFSI